MEKCQKHNSNAQEIFSHESGNWLSAKTYNRERISIHKDYSLIFKYTTCENNGF